MLVANMKHLKPEMTIIFLYLLTYLRRLIAGFILVHEDYNIISRIYFHKKPIP